MIFKIYPMLEQKFQTEMAQRFYDQAITNIEVETQRLLDYLYTLQDKNFKLSGMVNLIDFRVRQLNVAFSTAMNIESQELEYLKRTERDKDSLN
jgi:hypothetical protein